MLSLVFVVATAGVLPESVLQLPESTVVLVKNTPVETFDSAWERAHRENKPLVLWAGWTCAPCVSALTECVHVQTAVANNWGCKEGRVFVFPKNRGKLHRVEFEPGVTVEEIRAVLFPYGTCNPQIGCGTQGCAVQGCVNGVCGNQQFQGFGGGCVSGNCGGQVGFSRPMFGGGMIYRDGSCGPGGCR